MIEHEAIVSIVHFEQRRACQSLTIAILDEPTAHNA